METGELIERLAREAQPVRGLASPTVRFLRWLLFSAAYAMAVLVVLGTGPDLRESASSPAFLAATLLLMVAAVAAAWLAFCLSIPGRSGEPGVRMASRLVLAIGILAFAGLGGVLARSVGPPDRGWPCSLHLALTALAPGLLLWLMLRRAAPMQWLRTGLVAGVACAGIGALTLQFACCSGDAMHLAVWHGGPALLIIGACVAAGYRARSSGVPPR